MFLTKSLRVILSISWSILVFLTSIIIATAQPNSVKKKPLRIAIVGLVHGHVHGFLRDAMTREDVQVVGVFDEDEVLLNAYGDRYEVPAEIRYSSLSSLLDDAKPEAITVFSNTYDHTTIVETAAQQGIHVMMEKPLAVNIDHAFRMQKAAKAGNIHVLVNYETTWYPSNEAVYKLHEDGKLGNIRKMVIHDGHFGPKEIGVGEEFLEWLTDPVLNGGGALTDFGCYGANLMTWLMKGETPISVTAITQQLKDDPVYAEVDDEATILVEYEIAQGIIQASWNWPYHRKDMEVYGDAGYVFAPNRSTIRYSELDARPEGDVEAPALPIESADPLSYLKAVVEGRIQPAPHDLSSLENNVMVTRILDAARRSAETGRKVRLR